MYVEKDEDQVILLRDEEMDVNNIVKLVKTLFDRGVKFVGLETDLIKVYFDSDKNAGNKAITGKFKDKFTLIR